MSNPLMSEWETQEAFPWPEALTSEDAFAVSPPGGSQVLGHFQETKIPFSKSSLRLWLASNHPENVAHDPYFESH